MRYPSPHCRLIMPLTIYITQPLDLQNIFASFQPQYNGTGPPPISQSTARTGSPNHKAIYQRCILLPKSRSTYSLRHRSWIANRHHVMYTPVILGTSKKITMTEDFRRQGKIKKQEIPISLPPRASWTIGLTLLPIKKKGRYHWHRISIWFSYIPTSR